MDRYKQEKDLLNDKKDYFDFKENGLDFNKSERALEVLLGVAKLEQWYFDTSEKNDGNYNQRSDELVKKIEEMNNSSNLDPKKIEELYNQTGYFSYTKLFRITQKVICRPMNILKT
ncbi:MAG: hypothetical protein HC932_02320 [Thermales bacterium]|nr:hypothetical protein [Thermales bacterium]